MRFELDEGEKKRLRLWDFIHIGRYHDGEEPDGGAIGGRVQFTIVPTSVGDAIGVECSHCRHGGRELDVYHYNLTDYTDW